MGSAERAEGRLDRDVVVASLRPTDVIARYQVSGRIVGDELRTRLCPACGPRSRDAVAINLVTGRWADHAHGCAGDLLGLVAALAGLDARRDFQRVLELAADISGVGPDADPAAAQRAIERRREEEARADADRQRQRSAAGKKATAHWEALRPHHLDGIKYLEHERGLDAFALSRRGLVRFDRLAGDPHVALWSSAATVLNCVRRRRVPGDGPKVIGLEACPTAGTLVGHLQQIEPGGTTVIVEGVIDALTAAQSWPDATVLGAHGVSRYAMIGIVAAPRVARSGGRLLLVVHDDPPRADGSPSVAQVALAESIAAAREANCPYEVVDLGGSKDLNDAWRTGWRP